MPEKTYPIISNPTYDSITMPGALEAEKRNIDTFLQDHDHASGNKKSPWRIDAPSKRIREAKVTMWIYNVSPRKHQISTLPGMPKVLGPCPEGAEYGVPLAIREVTLDYAGQGDYKLKAVEVDDLDLAGSIVCPSCLGVGNGCQDSADLRRWGVFYSYNNPPTKEELTKAHAHLSNTLSELCKIADSLWEDPKKRWQVTGANGDVYRMAAKAKGLQRPWCTPISDKTACPACGMTNENNAMVCSNLNCAILLNYKKALKFRKITQAEFDEALASGLINEDGKVL